MERDLRITVAMDMRGLEKLIEALSDSTEGMQKVRESLDTIIPGLSDWIMSGGDINKLPGGMSYEDFIARLVEVSNDIRTSCDRYDQLLREENRPDLEIESRLMDQYGLDGRMIRAQALAKRGKERTEYGVGEVIAWVIAENNRKHFESFEEEINRARRDYESVVTERDNLRERELQGRGWLRNNPPMRESERRRLRQLNDEGFNFPQGAMRAGIDVFESKLNAPAPELKDIMDVLRLAYVRMVTAAPHERLNMEFLDDMVGTVLSSDFEGAIWSFFEAISNPYAPKEDVFKNLKEDFGNFISWLNELESGSGDVFAESLFANLTDSPRGEAARAQAFAVLRQSICDELKDTTGLDDAAVEMLAGFYQAMADGNLEMQTPESVDKYIQLIRNSDLPGAIESLLSEAQEVYKGGGEALDKVIDDFLNNDVWNSLKDAYGDFDWDDQLRNLVYSSVLPNSEWYKQAGVDVGTAYVHGFDEGSARAFNEAFGGTIQTDNMLPLNAMANAGDTSFGALVRKNFGDFVDDFSLPPLAEDLSNIDEVLARVNEGLAFMERYKECVGHLPQFEKMQEHLLGAEIALHGLNGAFSPMRANVREVNSEFERQDAQMRKFAQNAPIFGEFKKGVQDLARAGKQELGPELKALGEKLDFNNTTVKGALVSLHAYEKEMNETADSADALGVQLLLLANQAYIHGEISLDEQQAIEAAVAAGMSVEEFAAKCAEYGINLKESGGGKRGGGGKSRKERAAEEARKAAEEAQRAQEAAWQKQLDDQLKFLDRKKRLGEISTQEEIRQLEIIAAKYAKTTQQKISMEEKLFEAKARLRDEEIGQIDKLNQGIITAISNRYQEQRKIEEKRLKASSDSWREWADESVKAIQAQIDALDALAKSEDREEQERKKLHKIEATRQMIEFTHDEANREQLERELRRLEEDFAKWQRNNAMADAKEQLRAEQDAIRERAAAEQEAINNQREELAELYDERLKSAALRAEAERMLVQANQEEILDLITSYAPDYDAAGKTLGQRLHEGLTGELGPLVDWFNGLNNWIDALQRRMMEPIWSAVDAFEATSQQREAQQNNTAPPVEFHSVYNFNMPVESPTDTARKIQQVNEALATQLMYRA